VQSGVWSGPCSRRALEASQWSFARMFGRVDGKNNCTQPLPADDSLLNDAAQLEHTVHSMPSGTGSPAVTDVNRMPCPSFRGPVQPRFPIHPVLLHSLHREGRQQRSPTILTLSRGACHLQYEAAGAHVLDPVEPVQPLYLRHLRFVNSVARV